MNASELIDNRIASLTDWRGEMFAHLRQVIQAAEPDLTEEWKWDTAVWSEKGLVCAVNAFKDHVLINFFHGAALEDPHGLFNSGLDAKATRSISLRKGGTIDEPALQDLIRAAVAKNAGGR
jgi:hypothetical protein